MLESVLHLPGPQVVEADLESEPAWVRAGGGIAMTGDLDRQLGRAVTLLASAESLLITAGAGIGIDSGLPDFRGEAGFWRAYPALAECGLQFQDLASPRQFESNPRRAWGFYGHRLSLYRRTRPHAGFGALLGMARRLSGGGFVFTSNVDGQFQLAGFSPEAIYECNGSIHWLQCLQDCSGEIWPAVGFEPQTDETRCELLSDLPHCPQCGAIARPNILMFNDPAWNERRALKQRAALNAWIEAAGRPVVIELGAGTATPTVRALGDRARERLIRINPAEPWVPDSSAVSLPLGALEAVSRLSGLLQDGRQGSP